ncbi:unnamed protein product [Owenia fusiformis]|uniref:Uncharacterized protein n=1 Tax=Owenia fusiformis TaxID=6347 RepID=A0A8J1UD81_OWEFU|nr:unnamed protein product [Owenia fusiformis]
MVQIQASCRGAGATMRDLEMDMQHKQFEDYTLTKLSQQSATLHSNPKAFSKKLRQRAKQREMDHYKQWRLTCCLRVAITIVLMMAIAATLAWYFFAGPGKPEETILIAHSEKLTDHQNIVYNAVKGRVHIISHQYTAQLGNSNSTIYRALKAKMQLLLTAAFKDIESFKKVLVTDFTEGSIVVDYTLFFTKPKDEGHLLSKPTFVIEHYLKKTEGMLGPFRIQQKNLDFQYIQNECKKNNGGCAFQCIWSLGSQQYLCICPQGQTLTSDKHTCKKAPKDDALEGNTSPCSGSNDLYFPCSPKQCMTCDGYADCDNGKDEASALCTVEAATENFVHMTTTSKPTNSVTMTTTKQTMKPFIPAAAEEYFVMAPTTLTATDIPDTTIVTTKDTVKIETDSTTTKNRQFAKAIKSLLKKSTALTTEDKNTVSMDITGTTTPTKESTDNNNIEDVVELQEISILKGVVPTAEKSVPIDDYYNELNEEGGEFKETTVYTRPTRFNAINNEDINRRYYFGMPDDERRYKPKKKAYRPAGFKFFG